MTKMRLGVRSRFFRRTPGNFELIGANSKKERGAFKGAPFFRFSPILRNASIAIPVAVIAVPVTIVVAMVFTPFVLPPFTFAPLACSPLMAAVPLQPFIGFVALMPPVAGFRAVVAEALNRYVETPIGVRRAPVAIVPIIRLGAGRAGKEQESAERDSRQCCFAEHRFQQMLMQSHNILLRASPRLVGVASHSYSSNTAVRIMF